MIVSILILLEVPLQQIIYILSVVISPVSILILLEVPLQPNKGDVLYMVKKCFNPYFTGSTTSTYLSKRF